MFKSKKKIDLTDDEQKIIFYALNELRTKSLKEGKYVDVINETISKVRTKMKVDKYILGTIINALINMRETINAEIYDTSIIQDLILKLYEIHKTLK